MISHRQMNMISGEEMWVFNFCNKKRKTKEMKLKSGIYYLYNESVGPNVMAKVGHSVPSDVD